MCADNNSDRRSQNGEGRHHRNSPSRQLASLLAMRIYESLQGQTATPPARSTHAVGRVGALAVALGIGTAILGFSPAAAADGPDSAGSAGQESSRPADSGSRSGGPARRSGGSAAPADAGAAPASEPRSSRASRSGRGSGAVEAGSAAAAQARRTGTTIPAAGVAQAPPADIARGSATPAQAAPSITVDPVAPVAVRPAVAVAESAAPGDVAVPDNAAVSPVRIAAAADEAPVMTAVTADVLADGDVDPTALLGGDGTGDPAAAPLAWAALAFARRTDLAGATPEVAPAAAVSTGEPAVGPAAAGAAESQVDVGASFAIDSVNPDSGAVGETIQITLKNVPQVFNLGSVKFGCIDSGCKDGAKAVNPTRSGNVVTAVVPDGAVTGLIEVNSLTGTVFALSGKFTVTGDPTAVPLPQLPACNNKGNCDYLTSTIPIIGNVRVVLTNKIAEAVEKAFPTSGTAGGCKPSGCPIVDGGTTASVSNTIGMYGFNVVYALSGPLDPPVVGQQLVNLVTQPNVLTFISQTVANDFSIVGGKFPILPPNVAATLGNAAAVFVQNSFGNQTVATALAPFLYSLNVPTTSEAIIPFVKVAATSATKALLGTFNPQQGQQALINDFFTVPAVQQQLGSAFAGAISVLLGQSSPSWAGAPAASGNAVSNYLGQLAANGLLGETNTNTPALATTIGTALQNLFTAINTPLGASASSAFQALLNAPVVIPGQDNTPTVLADFMVNTLYNFLQAPATNPPPFPNQPPLLKALAPAAGYAATNFVNSLFSQANVGTVSAALGQFVNQVVPGVLANPGIQDEIGAKVSDLVSVLVGDGLGAVVGPQVADAVVALVSNPLVEKALTTFVNTALGGFLGSPGVVPVLANAAGTLTAGQLGGTYAAALQQARQDLQNSPAIANGADAGVTAAVAGLLSNKAVWAEVDSALSLLVVTVLGDEGVQAALAKEVATLVAGKVKGPLGQFIGDQLGAVAVSLATNPVVQYGLQGVVDTLFSDFWSSQGVVTAFSEAAGTLAAAQVSGDLKTVAPQVAAQLRANLDVQAGVQTAFGDAMTVFLGDGGLWSAVDATLSAAVIQLTTDPAVLNTLGNSVQSAVEVGLGEPLGGVVGPQVAAAVVQLVSSQVIATGLIGVVDTLFTDFFGAPGVVDAFSGAAGQWALVLLTTGSLSAAAKAGQQELKASPAVDAGIDLSVTAAVADLLGDKALWYAVDKTVSSLAATLLGDVEVQDALAEQVAKTVADNVKGPLGQFLGAQLGTVVVELVTNPVVESGLLGVVDTLVSDFWTTSGVVTAFSQAAGELAAAALTGDLDTVAPQVTAALRANAAVQAGAQRAVGAAVAEFLGNRSLWSAVDGTLSVAVIELSSNPLVLNALQTAVANQVTILVGAELGAVVGPQVGAAVVQFVSDPAVVTGLIGAVDTLSSKFFGSAGVVDAFAAAASEFALVLVAGGGLSKAVEAAGAELTGSPAVQSGVRTALADTLGEIDTAIFGNPAVQQLLGTITTNLIEELAGDEPVQALVAERYGAAVAGLLANTAVVDEIATQLGSAVTGLLAYPGVSTAVTDSIALFAAEWLGGAKESVALSDALKALQANTAFIAGVNAVIPPAVNTILADPAALSAIAVVVGDEVVAALQRVGIKNTFLDKLAAQVAKGAAQSFLTRKAGIALVDDLAVKLVLGMPFSKVTGFVGDEVLHKPALQIALGLSIGQGIGSLFGDNFFGRLVGTMVGIPTAVTISVVSGLVNFFDWLSRVFRPAQAVPTTADLYAMTVQSAPGAAAGDAPFRLSRLAVTEPDGDQPGSVDIAMAVDAHLPGDEAAAPVTVSFRVPLDSLLAS